MRVWNEFYSLLRESIIFQGILTLLIFATICYLIIAQLEVPVELYGFAGIIVGFFFGSKVSYTKKGS